MDMLTSFSSPQLEKIHSGKVRESFRWGDDQRLIVVTDRISAFDRVLDTPIPYKGAVLNCLSDFWFRQTADIVDNHVVRLITPNVTLVRNAVPIRVEMVVRGYLTGSMWQRYKKGKRNFCGLKIQDDLEMNYRFPVPIITPTTKEDVDREMSPTELIEQGWTDKDNWERMEETALRLFQAGTALLESRGLLLADTKYEFGVIDEKLVLIDEIHTPDSSRIWPADRYAENKATVQQLDKEFVRIWLREATRDGVMPSALPADIVSETSRRYLELYEKVTGEPLPRAGLGKEGIRAALVAEGMIKDGFVAVVMGSKADEENGRKLAQILRSYGVAVALRIASAHKNGEDVATLAREYNESVEPGAVIAVAGLSNGLGGALAANLTIPVINCPPFRDETDLALNIHSSLMMPSNVPAATVLKPRNAALAALRSLNLHRLRGRFLEEIELTKAQLRAADEEIRGMQ